MSASTAQAMTVHSSVSHMLTAFTLVIREEERTVLYMSYFIILDKLLSIQNVYMTWKKIKNIHAWMISHNGKDVYHEYGYKQSFENIKLQLCFFSKKFSSYPELRYRVHTIKIKHS